MLVAFDPKEENGPRRAASPHDVCLGSKLCLMMDAFLFFMLRVGTDVSFPAVPLLSKALEKVRQDAVCGPGSCVAWNRTFCSLPSPYCFCVIKSS